MENTIPCPFCPFTANRKVKELFVTYKGQQYPIKKDYYECVACEEQFSTPEMDEIALKQVYEAYTLDKTGIMNPGRTQEVSQYCEGELCSVCRKSAVQKIAQVIFDDMPIAHELTAYLCLEHFDMVLRPYRLKKDV